MLSFNHLEYIDKVQYNIAKSICDQIQSCGYQAYFVGGCVRDLLRITIPNDYDITTSATPDQIKTIFENDKLYTLRTIGEQFLVCQLHSVVYHFDFEIATMRTEGTYSDGRHPDEIHITDVLEHDLARRDFSCNALAYDPVSDELFDFSNGLIAIQNSYVQFVGDPEKRIKEDKLRILRAFRFKAQLGYTIATSSLEAIARSIAEEGPNLLSGVSMERVTSEFTKIMISEPNDCYSTLHLMAQAHLLQIIIPEIQELIDCEHNNPYHLETDYKFGNSIFTHTLNVIRNTPPDLELRLAALLHDIGKPRCCIEVEC